VLEFSEYVPPLLIFLDVQAVCAGGDILSWSSLSSQSGEYLAALTGDAITIHIRCLYPRSTFTGWRKLDIFLGGRPTPSILCLAKFC